MTCATCTRTDCTLLLTQAPLKRGQCEIKICAECWRKPVAIAERTKR